MRDALSRIFVPPIFEPIAVTITVLAIFAFVGDLLLPDVFKFDPLFLVYSYMGLYAFSAFSAFYEAIQLFRGKSE